MMEEHIKMLASLQVDLKAKEDATNADGIVISLRETVDDAAKHLEEAKAALADELISYESSCEQIEMEIKNVKAQIIDAWDGEKKTLNGNGWMLKFRTTGKLIIRNDQLLLEDLMDNLPTAGYIMKYLKGFNLTKLKEYMKTYPQPTDVAELVPTTTVSLTTE